MSPPPRPSVVRVVAAGAALSLAATACNKPEKPFINPPPPPERPVTENPPAPEPAPAPDPAPASTLPAWDDVESGHPEGATNPPIPVLEVTADGLRCFKHWQSPMIPDRDAIRLGGRVLDDATAARGVEVQCPEDRRDALIAAHDAAKKGAQPPGDGDR